MPSHKWDSGRPPLIAAAISAATTEAWRAPDDGRIAAFLEALRRMVGPEILDEIEMRALDIFVRQRDPPAGYEPPPEWAWFTVCPGCQSLRATKHTRAQNGRIKLEVLRDPEWIARRFERAETPTDIARTLDCTPGIVRYWADKHGLVTPARARQKLIEKQVRRGYWEGVGPGALARELDTTVTTVRRYLKRLGLANRKNGQVYHRGEWWRARLARGMSKAACAREAGIKSHNANYYIDKFNLGHLVNSDPIGRPTKYPELADRENLRRLLEKHDGVYAHVAEDVGCAQTTVARQAKRLLGRKKKLHDGADHYRRAWWAERLDAGKTTWEMAGEAGVTEKTAREKLRGWELLRRGYQNNAQRERENRRQGSGGEANE